MRVFKQKRVAEFSFKNEIINKYVFFKIELPMV
jgi:hypothetical protein